MRATQRPPTRSWSGNRRWRTKMRRCSVIGLSLRAVGLVGLAAAIACGAVRTPAAAQSSAAIESNDPWPDLARDAFSGRPLVDGAGVIAIDMPERAEDAGIVPVTMRTALPPGDMRVLKSFTLVIDENPAPVAATFKVDSGVTTISTRVRVNSYTDVHAVAELSDGQLYVVDTYIKASGGCSAPMAKNAEEAKATLGAMRLRQFARSSGGPASILREAQIMVRHPNNSGLQRDQVSLLYIPLFIVRELRVWQGDQLVLEMDGGISISEDPNIRFSYRPNGAAIFRAEAVDTEGHVFKGEWPIEPAT
jgi:sulfur-oxidizing protein SoxY